MKMRFGCIVTLMSVAALLTMWRLPWRCRCRTGLLTR